MKQRIATTPARRRILSARQQLAATALAQGKSLRAVSAEHGISRSVLARWRTWPEFNEAIVSLCEEMRERAITELNTNVMPKAVKLLERVLVQEPEGPVTTGEQLHAARLAMQGAGVIRQGAGGGPAPASPQVAVLIIGPERGAEVRAEIERRRAAREVGVLEVEES